MNPLYDGLYVSSGKYKCSHKCPGKIIDTECKCVCVAAESCEAHRDRKRAANKIAADKVAAEKIAADKAAAEKIAADNAAAEKIAADNAAAEKIAAEKIAADKAAAEKMKAAYMGCYEDKNKARDLKERFEDVQKT